jgi:hypothetical protein
VASDILAVGITHGALERELARGGNRRLPDVEVFAINGMNRNNGINTKPATRNSMMA